MGGPYSLKSQERLPVSSLSQMMNHFYGDLNDGKPADYYQGGNYRRYPLSASYDLGGYACLANLFSPIWRPNPSTDGRAVLEEVERAP
jgi:hypothetical protein